MGTQPIYYLLADSYGIERIVNGGADFRYDVAYLLDYLGDDGILGISIFFSAMS